jgi:hypothetical protein
MTSIYKASAIDLGYSPDFEIVMAPENIMAYAFNRFLRRVREGTQEAEFLERLLDIILRSKREEAAYLWDPSKDFLEETVELYYKLSGIVKDAKITDGEKEGGDGYFVELGPGKQFVQIDLGARYALHAILAWHYHSQARVYRDVVVQVADDKDFLKGVTTVFNNDHDNSSGLGIGKDKEYIEVAEGRLFDPKGATGRYVRMFSNGNTVNDLNHYVEVEVYGTPVK